MKVRHVAPVGWVDTSEAGVIQPSDVSGLSHEIELEAGDLMQGPQGEPGPNVVGMVAFFAMASAPVGWLVCDGAAVSRAAYAALFAAIGEVFGPGDGVETFHLPDLRGEFLRGWDGGRGVDGDRGFGTVQADEIKEHTHQVETAKISGIKAAPGSTASLGYQAQAGGLVTGPTGGAETRPRNVALLPCIATGL